MSAEADLIIVGAGAKAAAIAMKVHVLNRLGLGPIALTIVEATEPAASWSGRNGMTSGEEPLAIPPIKDVGFPYQSYEAFGEEYGDEIDRASMPFCWQQYLIGERGYVRWVNAGSPPIQHRTYGKYLAWVLSGATAGVNLVRGRVMRVSLEAPARGYGAADEPPGGAGEPPGTPGDYPGNPDDYPGNPDEPPAAAGEPSRPEAGPEASVEAGQPAERWVVDVADSNGSPRYVGRALALTGPGVHRPFPHAREAAGRIFHCDSRRIELARIPIEQNAEIAIVGGGESALSCVAFLRAFRPDAELTVYTPSLPLSRGESFLENRVFSNPDEVAWSELDEQTRRDFVRHCDRGVFDPQTLASISYDEKCRFVTGRVRYVSAAGGGSGGHDKGVWVRYECASGEERERYDYAVNCTGFDLLEQLRSLFPPAVRSEIEGRVGGLWELAPGREISIGRYLELEGMRPRLHIPGLGALSQGPGFANLGCLGLLANRVLEPLFREKRGHEPAEIKPMREVV